MWQEADQCKCHRFADVSMNAYWRYRYIFALLAVPLAIGLRFALTPLIGQGVPYVTLFAVTAIVAVLGGAGPAILNGILAAVLTDYFFVEPLHVLDFNLHFISRTAVVVVTSGFIGHVGDALRSARNRAQEQASALRASLERSEFLAGILNHASQPFAVGYPDGRVGMMNSAFEQLTGYTRQELQSIDWSTTLTPPEWRQAEQEKLQELHRTGQPVRYEKEYIRKDGSRISIELLVHLVRDAHGKPEYYYSFVTDITQRKAADEVIRRSEATLRGILHATKESIWLFSPDGTIITGNEMATSRFDPDGQRVIGKHFTDVLPPALAASRLADLQRVVESARPMESEDERAGMIFHHDWYPILDAGGRVTSVACFSRDITARRNAEDALRQTRDDLARSNKDLEQFAYVASHDLQEPLRAVAGFVELLRRHLGDGLDAKAAGYVDFAVDGAKRMQTLINGLLEYSRVARAGQMDEMIDARAALDAATSLMRKAIDESHAVITADALPVIRFNQTQLSQLFQNLIGNAIRFRRDDIPRIHIGAARNGAGWKFSVADNGIGIEPEYSERIFLLFQRLHSREQYKGTGIGLAICKRIVEHHKGKIWVESTPGQGSTFCFTIPDKGTNA
jgi:PAS domain S-box-containing protein